MKQIDQQQALAKLQAEYEGKLLAACNVVKNASSLIIEANSWHPASDEPETKDGWFIALTKDNLPFLTHYVNGWLPQVHMWKYIFMPMNNESL